ncbi:MAG: putative selenate reductase subunit YgfK, partial [Clostridia bacterium]|nr:putative selenate reductase subunit YgfK [Clostridia bacterium]
EATPIWAECMAWAKANLSRFEHIDEAYLATISPVVCTSGTLSTLHGCPPTEIERIATYLIEEKGLNTFVKCNPTLLGYHYCRKTLDDLGFDYVSFDEFHFNDDLQYADAVPMFRRLLARAEAKGLSFGLKLSNTFPVQIKRNELPGEEMYMSGRSLYPLTIEMARRISKEFDGSLRLSFSGGIDYFNIEPLYEAGIWPITLATTLLKPGGYQRCLQMAQRLMEKPLQTFDGVSVGKVTYLAEAARHDPRLKKPVKPAPNRKLETKVPLSNCFTSPCSHGCPIHQDIPEYVSLVGKGEYEKALECIVSKNPLPAITGTICPHNCQDKCTRNFMEDSVHIRDAKLAAVKGGASAFIDSLTLPEKTGGKAAIVGGSPAGMAAAFFLGRAGMEVTLFEQRDRLGGIVRHVIPEFRISSETIDLDEALLAKAGVEIKLNTPAPALSDLKAAGYETVLYATGAWKHGSVALEKGAAMNVLDFLLAAKAGECPDLGTDPIVIGGGNTAMDAARAAKRIKGVENCRLVYRRTRQYMPADEEELELALADGVTFCELLAPLSWEDGKLVCSRMVLGEPDASGRRSPVDTGETVALPCTALIAAVGEKVDGDFFAAQGLAINPKGKVVVDPLTLSAAPGVYVIGDANRGPATVVEAIADARRAADAILGAQKAEARVVTEADRKACYEKQGVLKDYDNAKGEGARCLDCGAVCECCVTVCPNRANIAIDVPGEPMPAILHMDNLCNECGNCLVFCPYDSAPYKEKFTLFSTEAFFRDSENPGFVRLAPGKFKVRLNGELLEVSLGDGQIDPSLERIMATVERDYSYLLDL